MCAFFNKFKKQETPVQPEKVQPIAAVVNADTALGEVKTEAKDEAKDVKSEEFETYDDEEDEENDNVENNEESEKNDEEIDNEETEVEGEGELERLKEKVKETEEKIKIEKQIKLRDKEIEEFAKKQREVVKERFGSQEELQQPQYIPVLMNEAEFLREILKRIQGLEVWASQLTNYLKERKL